MMKRSALILLAVGMISANAFAAADLCVYSMADGNTYKVTPADIKGAYEDGAVVDFKIPEHFGSLETGTLEVCPTN